MAKRIYGKGYTTDLSLGWVAQDLGSDWLQWQHYAVEWLANEDAGISGKLVMVKHLLHYLKRKAPYAYDVASMFKGHPSGHKVSSEEFDSYLQGVGSTVKNYEHISYAADFCDHILKNYLSTDNDSGTLLPLFANPFEKIKRKSINFETVRSPLPYRYIQQLRHILCPYPKNDMSNKKPWVGSHFSDWKWAIENLTYSNKSWMEVSPELIDPEDPDCIYRKRLVLRRVSETTKVKQPTEIHEIWSPAIAMLSTPV